MPLKSLSLSNSKIEALASVRGMPIEQLEIDSTPISDISPLEGLPLKGLRFSVNRIEVGIDVLRKIPSLNTPAKLHVEQLCMTDFGPFINGLCPTVFWKKFDAGDFSKRDKAEQDGADAPATAPQSEPSGNDNPNPESKPRPQ